MSSQTSRSGTEGTKKRKIRWETRIIGVNTAGTILLANPRRPLESFVKVFSVQVPFGTPDKTVIDIARLGAALQNIYSAHDAAKPPIR